MEPYSEKVMEHFRNPRNVGQIDNPDGVGHVGNPVCILGNTLIAANSEFKPIDSIRMREDVLGHDGEYHRVAQLHRRYYSGKVYSLEVQGLGRVTVTPEHHILAIKMGHLDRRYSRYKQFKPDWYCAEELQRGDIILYPIPKEFVDVSAMAFDIPVFRSKRFRGKINLTEGFLKLVGYYLADGYTRIDRSKGSIGFVFGREGKRPVEEVISAVDASFRIAPAALCEERNSISVVFSNVRLARFFCKYFGEGALDKRLPHFMMLLSPQRQRHIIAGLWRGDGYISEKGARFCTVSKQLAHQLKHLLMRQRIVFSFLTLPGQGIYKENYHIYVKSIPSLKELAGIVGVRYNWPDKKKQSLKAWYDAEYFYTRVKSKEAKPYRGDVFNLEVDDTHSYVSDSVCFHNCGDIMELYIKVDNGVITDAKFQTFGCGAAIATSSMVTEMVKGKTIQQALDITNRAVAEALDGLPPVKLHCSVLAEDALKGAINDYLIKTTGKGLPGWKPHPMMEDEHKG